MAEMAAINIFMEWKVFDKIPETGSISCKELAENIGAEYNLIGWSAPCMHNLYCFDFPDTGSLTRSLYRST